ncbi:hypothetical protein OH491_26675 [Termitidicoccus mucosus]
MLATESCSPCWRNWINGRSPTWLKFLAISPRGRPKPWPPSIRHGVADRVALLVPGGLRVTGTSAEVLREEILRPVYGGRLEVFAHSASGSPVVLPLAAR